MADTGCKKELKTAVVLDTDVGTDDAFAILAFSYFKDLRLDYLVASSGNASLEGATRNAIILKKYLGADTRIVMGIQPEKDKNVNEQEKNTFHGNDGLANISGEMTESLKLREEDLKEYIFFEEFMKKLLEYDDITYIGVGPTTNLAILIDIPEIKSRIKRIYLMGGGIEAFNCSHETEFNFSKNPKAVKKILESELDITMIPLDVTNRQNVDKDEIAALEATGNYPEFITFLKYNMKANQDYNHIDAAVLHDVLPVLYALRPDRFTVEDMKIAVDRYGSTKSDPAGSAVKVVTDVDEDLLDNFLTDAFRRR